MHGERQNCLRQFCRCMMHDGRWKMLEGGLGVHGLRVIDHGGDALSLERGLERIALGFAFEAKGVLCPTGIESLRNDGCLDA